MNYRIVYVINDLKHGGAEKSVINTLRKLKQRGWEVWLILLVKRGEFLKFAEKSGIKTICLCNNTEEIFKAPFRLYSLLKEIKPHVIHGHLFYSVILSRIVGALAKVPVIISSQRSTDPWRRWWHSMVDSITAKLVSAVISNSRAAADRLQKIENIPANKIYVVPNGIEYKPFEMEHVNRVRTETGASDGEILIVCIGRLHEAKGQDLLVKVMEKVKASSDIVFRVACIGDGPMAGELRRKVEGKKWFIPGYRDDAQAFIQAADIIAIPSRWEGFPNVLLESAMAGKPVIAFDVGGMRDIIQTEAVLVSRGDVDGMAEGIITLADNEALRIDMGNKLKKRVEENFTLDSSVQKTERIYRKYLKRKPVILHIITLSENGGATENTALTMEGLNDRMITHLACAPGGPLIDRAKDAGIFVHPLKYMKKNISPVNDLLALLEIFKLTLRIRPDIVHTHSSKAGILGRFGAWLTRPFFLFSKPYMVHTVHGLPFHSFQKTLTRFIYWTAEMIAGKTVDVLITVAPQVSEKAWRRFLCSGRRIKTVYSGIDFPETNDSADKVKNKLFDELGIEDNGGPVLCAVSRAAPLKKLDLTLQAAAGIRERYSGTKLLIAGDGPELSFLKKMAHERGMDDMVCFMGSREDIPDILAASDLLLHTSLLEGLPRVLPEAMLSSTPWVAFGVDGVRDASKSGKNGISVPPGDVHWMIEAADAILREAGYRNIMVERGLKWASARYKVERMTRDLYRVYMSLFRCY